MADLTLQVIAERLGCKPDALEIVEAIERMKDIIRRSVPAIDRQWAMARGGPRKSELLRLRRRAEKVANG